MIVISKEPIRDFYGKILGWVETDRQGNQQVRDFYGKILGTYNKSQDMTRDFYGRIVSKGNTVVGLIYKNSR